MAQNGHCILYLCGTELIEQYSALGFRMQTLFRRLYNIAFDSTGAKTVWAT